MDLVLASPVWVPFGHLNHARETGTDWNPRLWVSLIFIKSVSVQSRLMSQRLAWLPTVSYYLGQHYIDVALDRISVPLHMLHSFAS